MIRVGLVEFETSHKREFTKILHAGEAARVVAVCPGTVCPAPEAEEFVREHEIKLVVSEPAAMADEVDIGFILGTDWDRHLELARPFIEQGKAVFIDKPVAGCLKDCAELERLVNEEGARIVGSSSLRYLPACDEAKKEIAAADEAITYVSTTCQGEFDYAIHSVEMLGGLVGTGAQAVRWLGGEQPSVHQVVFESGVIAMLHLNGPKSVGFCAEIGTAETYRQLKFDGLTGYRALMEKIVKYMQGEESGLASIEALTESIRIALAARVSREQGGALVRLADLEPADPGFDGAAFAAAYGAKKRAAAR